MVAVPVMRTLFDTTAPMSVVVADATSTNAAPLSAAPDRVTVPAKLLAPAKALLTARNATPSPVAAVEMMR
jgi:hypothetical protein